MQYRYTKRISRHYMSFNKMEMVGLKLNDNNGIGCEKVKNVGEGCLKYKLKRTRKGVVQSAH